MNKKTNEYEHLSILRKIHSEKNINQRQMAEDLGLSLGKLNFCLNELKKKGFVKYRNFKKNKNKINYSSRNNQKNKTSSELYEAKNG